MKRHPLLYSLLAIGITLGLFLIAMVLILGLVSKGSGSAFLMPGSIQVIKISGPIFESEPTMEEIREASDDDHIKAVVLRIDSPGGAVSPSQEIFEEVKKLKKKKKVVVSMGAVCASGGYYIASAADKIVAMPGTITGSIGVIIESFGFQDVIKKIDLESRVIKTGDFKDVGNPFREMTPGDKEYLKRIIMNMYGQFKRAVSEGRGFDETQVELLAQGKIYTGEQALEVKLVDRLGTLYDAIEEAKLLAKLPKDAKVVWPREDDMPFGLFKSFFKSEVFKKSYHEAKMPSWLYMMQ